MLIIINNYSERDIVDGIKYLLKQSTENPDVDTLANRIISQDLGSYIKAVHDWVSNNVAYVRDPIVGDSEIELFISPVRMAKDYLAGKQLAGDCDDHALLTTALYRALNFDARVVLLSFSGGGWEHAVAEVYSEKLAQTTNPWLTIDSTVKEFPAGWPEEAVRRLVV